MLIINSLTRIQHPQHIAAASLQMQGKRRAFGSSPKANLFVASECGYDCTIDRNWETSETVNYLKFIKRPAF